MKGPRAYYNFGPLITILSRWFALASVVQKYFLTGTKVPILTPEELRGSRRDRSGAMQYSVHLLYQYKSTNTDT